MEGQGSPYALKKDGGYLFGVFGVAYAEIMGETLSKRLVRFQTLQPNLQVVIESYNQLLELTVQPRKSKTGALERFLNNSHTQST